MPLFTDLSSSLMWFNSQDEGGGTAQHSPSPMTTTHPHPASPASVAHDASEGSENSLAKKEPSTIVGDEGHQLDRWQLLLGKGQCAAADEPPACLQRLKRDKEEEPAPPTVEDQGTTECEHQSSAAHEGGVKPRGHGRRPNRRHQRVVEAMRQQAMAFDGGAGGARVPRGAP